MKGFQDLNETEKRTCAELAAKAGLMINDASYIWLSSGGALLMHLHADIQIVVSNPENWMLIS
jgi:hypothetical protein